MFLLYLSWFKCHLHWSVWSVLDNNLTLYILVCQKIKSSTIKLLNTYDMKRPYTFAMQHATQMMKGGIHNKIHSQIFLENWTWHQQHGTVHIDDDIV